MDLPAGDTLAAAYLASGRLAPDFENLELKVGPLPLPRFMTKPQCGC